MKYISALLLIGISHFLLAQSQEKKTEPFIDQLEVGDTMTIAINMHGCLYFSTHSIVIWKSEKGYYSSNGIENKILSKKDLMVIQKFETTPAPIGCPAGTDYNVYLFTLGKKTRQKTNECSNWKPYKRLMKKLEFSKPAGFLETL